MTVPYAHPAGRVTPSAWSLVLLVLLPWLTACGTAQPEFPVQKFRAGDLQAMRQFAERELTTGDPENEALVHNVLGQCELLEGALPEARRSLAVGYQVMGTWAVEGSEVYGALFGDESSKTYRGDPYERTMNAFFLALADLWSGEPDNARACLINGMQADAENSDERYQADNALLFWMAGRMGRLSGSADVDDCFADARKANEMALQRGARGSLQAPVLQDPTRGNLVVLAGCGMGPEKYAKGTGDPIARFRSSNHPAHGVRVLVDDQLVGTGSLLMDVDFQATTYKGEAMEGVRKGKFVAKVATAVVGVELAKSAARETDRDRAAAKAAAAGVFLLFAWLVSSDADVRHWPTLPSSVQVVAADVPPGPHTLTVEFLDAAGAVLPQFRQSASIVVPRSGEAWYLAQSIAGRALVGPGIPPRAPTSPQP